MRGSPAGTILSALTACLPSVRLWEAGFGCSFVRHGFLLPLTCPDDCSVSFFSRLFSRPQAFISVGKVLRNKRAKVRRIKRRKRSEKAKDGEKERQSNQNPGLETQSKKMAPSHPSPPLPSPWPLVTPC